MNSVNLIGRITREPAVAYSESGTCVARFSIAIDRGKRNGEDAGADYPNIVCFGKTAELVEKYLGKGRLIGIQGRIQTGSYEKDGRKVYTTEVVADRVEFLDRGDKSDISDDEANTNRANRNVKPSGSEVPGFTEISQEDIPFS